MYGIFNLVSMITLLIQSIRQVLHSHLGDAASTGRDEGPSHRACAYAAASRLNYHLCLPGTLSDNVLLLHTRRLQRGV
jgi:hypothetical protein